MQDEIRSCRLDFLKIISEKFNLAGNLSKMMLLGGNFNFQQNPLLALSMIKGDNTSELSKLAMINGNNPNGLNNMLGLEGYSGFGKK